MSIQREHTDYEIHVNFTPKEGKPLPDLKESCKIGVLASFKHYGFFPDIRNFNVISKSSDSIQIEFTSNINVQKYDDRKKIFGRTIVKEIGRVYVKEARDEMIGILSQSKLFKLKR